jgi:hypothetical protein
MVGSSDESNYLPISRQALNRTLQLFPMILVTILLTALIAVGSVSAQESAACDQYECTEESAACDQYGCTAGPGPDEPASVGRIDPKAAGTPAVEPAPKVESVVPAEENVVISEPTTSEANKVVQESEPISAGNAQYQTTDPTPMPQTVLRLTETEATHMAPSRQEQVEDEIERDSSGAQSESSAAESAKPEDPKNTNEDENGSEEDENIDEALPGYPYEGEPCEESNCGLEDIETPVECATYETASGKRIYGCSNSETYEKKGCYEVTFYTEDGKPYSNLDTCSGEKPYAPPEQPERDFDYWPPPEDERGRLNLYDYWNGSDREADLCRKDSGEVQWHCGLDAPKTWICDVYYDTSHGTARGCFDPKDFGQGDCYGVHLYDEVGNHLGMYQNCFETQEKSCGEDQCGLEDDVPARWECSRVEHNYWGDLYGSEVRVAIWCEDSVLLKRLDSGRWNDSKKACAIIFNEDGRRIQQMPCTPQGDSHIGKKAGKDAENADKTLNGHDESTSLAEGSSSSDTSEWGSDYFGGDQAPKEQTSRVSNAAGSDFSLPGGWIPLPVDMLDPSVATLERNTVVSATLGSSEAATQSAGSGLLGDDTSRSANISPDGARSRILNTESDFVHGASYSSPTHETNLLETMRYAPEENPGRTNYDFNAHEPSETSSTSVKGRGQADMGKNTRWPEIAAGIRRVIASFPLAGGVEGWLGTVLPIAGLGAISGIFVLRKRFFR